MELTPFEDRAVTSVGVEIRNAAGGLSEALGIDPAEWHHGEGMTVVLRCEVSKVRFDPVKDSDDLRRVHVLTASDATVIDSADVDAALDAQAQRIEEAQGITRLDFATAEKQVAHESGEHASGLVDGCPACADEADALAAES